MDSRYINISGYMYIYRLCQKTHWSCTAMRVSQGDPRPFSRLFGAQWQHFWWTDFDQGGSILVKDLEFFTKPGNTRFLVKGSTPSHFFLDSETAGVGRKVWAGMGESFTTWKLEKTAGGRDHERDRCWWLWWNRIWWVAWKGEDGLSIAWKLIEASWIIFKRSFGRVPPF